MNEKSTPKRNVVFILLSIVFILVTIGFTFIWLTNIPSIEGMSYPLFHLLQAMVFALTTVAFIFRKEIGWYLAAGYFILRRCLPWCIVSIRRFPSGLRWRFPQVAWLFYVSNSLSHAILLSC